MNTKNKQKNFKSFLSFTDFLKNVERKRHTDEISFDKLIMMSENIASGMSELVRLGVVHRDLAARNVMVDKWLQVSILLRPVKNLKIRLLLRFGISSFNIIFYLQAKVGDFGLAREGAEYKMELEDDFGDRKKVLVYIFSFAF